MMLISFVLIAVCLSLGDGQVTPLTIPDRLPGLDHLESGFNEVKMASLTVGDKQSRFRIFDLNEKGRHPFRLTLGNVDRLYETPLAGQVTNIGQRRDRTCESVATDFKQFYSSFFQSTRSVSRRSGFFFSRTTTTHETLKRVYDAITRKSQAVATSTSWWGLYSIQLGPPFVLKWDPMFNASVSALVDLGAGAKSEAEQSLYNMIVETFGTHYVSQVIVGATAHIYTFINENYVKTSSFEEMTRQVSQSSSFFIFFNSNSGSSIHTIDQNAAETFRKNSERLATYEPPVALIPNRTEWQSWVDTAFQHPVVVNRTIVPLSHLFYRYPPVQSHLRRTIDYYLSNGNLPSYAQLEV